MSNKQKREIDRHIEQPDYSQELDTHRVEYPTDYSHVMEEEGELGLPDDIVPYTAPVSVSHRELDIQPEDKAVIVAQDAEKFQLKIAEGCIIDIRTADGDYLDRVLDMRQSYLGVKPRKAGDFVGRWLTCLGCMVIPMERSKEVIDRETGEVQTKRLRWNAVLFKLDKIDDETGLNVIMSGGGQSAMELAMLYAMRGKVGDWDQPREIFVSQEERQITKQQYDSLSKEVRELTSPGRMYRIAVRPIQKGNN